MTPGPRGRSTSRGGSGVALFSSHSTQRFKKPTSDFRTKGYIQIFFFPKTVSCSRTLFPRRPIRLP